MCNTLINKEIDYKEFLSHIIDLCHKVQLAYNENLKDLLRQHMLPLFDAGYINIDRQYLTIGINGLVESAEFMGFGYYAKRRFIKNMYRVF